MSVDHLYFAWATDPEGHPWVQHKCLNGEVDEFRPPNPPWKIVGDHIEPSFDCAKCGRHTILWASDRVPWEAFAVALRAVDQNPLALEVLAQEAGRE